MENTLTFYTPIQKELRRVEENLQNLSQVGFSPLASLLGHTFETPGKRVRPSITLLASKFHQAPSPELPIKMATAVELLHVATLIHDDTVDNADVRRGKATASNLWGPQTAVLLGDYVFATSATFVCDTKNIRCIRRFSETIMELSTGELMERFSSFDWRQTREQYLQRIYNKTASLFCTASESGAILSGAPEHEVQALKAYGVNLGMAFQIVDDILDFEGVAEEVGKPVGSDLAQGTLTLPALLMLESHPQDNPITALFERRDPEANLPRALEMIHNSTILQDSFAVAADYCEKARQALTIFQAGSPKAALLEVTAYVLERRK